jgi:uncharacterized RDD family membrane protein YckC
MTQTLPPSFPTASVSKRLAAIVYETLLLLALLFVADYLFISLTHNRQSMPFRIGLQLWLASVIGVYFVWQWRHGQSLAMKTWRMRLVTRDNQPLTLTRSIVRLLFAICLPVISQLWAFVDRDRQFLHDRLAGTRLVSLGKR